MKDNKAVKILLIATTITLATTLATYMYLKVENGYIKPLKITYSFIYE